MDRGAARDVRAGAYAGGTIVPIDQERLTNSLVGYPRCGVESSSGDMAKGFEFFDSVSETELGCESDWTIVFATQQSGIDDASMTGSGNAFLKTNGDGEGTVTILGDSSFEVTFEVPALTAFALEGRILADAHEEFEELAVRAELTLTGPDGQTVFSHSIHGRGGAEPDGLIEERGVLDPGPYTLTALAQTLYDASVPAIAVGDASFDFEIGFSIVGDLDGDGRVGMADLLILLVAWGPCEDCGDCPGDLDGDCTVGTGDLIVMLGNWG